MNNAPFEGLSFNTYLSKADALVQLSQLTGFDDQTLLEKMPLLKDYDDSIRLLPMGHKKIQVVLRGKISEIYIVTSGEKSFTIELFQRYEGKGVTPSVGPTTPTVEAGADLDISAVGRSAIGKTLGGKI